MKFKLIRFHFDKQNYKDFLGILPYDAELPEFYGLEARKIGWSNSEQGCRNIARKFKYHGTIEKNIQNRIEEILSAEKAAAKLRIKHALEWTEHVNKHQGVKHIK